MPTFVLVCQIDKNSNINTLKSNNCKLCIGIATLTTSGTYNYPVVAHATDIEYQTVVTWTDDYQISASTPSGDNYGPVGIACDQIYNLASKTATVANDDNGPNNGVRFQTDEKASATFYQTFDGITRATSTTDWLEPGAYPVAQPLKVAVWFENTSSSTNSTVHDSAKFEVDFVDCFSKIIRFSSNDIWSLCGPADTYTAGAILDISDATDGYVISQMNERGGEPPSGGIGFPPIDGVKTRQSFSWGFGPVVVTGYVDTDKLEIGVTVSVMGIELGTFYANLNDGLVLTVDLLAASGKIRFYLKNTKELWVYLELKVIFDGSFQTDEKIISF